jgi:transcriptional regulator with XRE-family HTH domain
LDERLIVEKIKEIRLSRNLSLEKLADLAGLTKGYLSRIENSTNSPPVSTLAKISKALNVDITEFFSDNLGPPELTDISITKKGERLKVGGNERLRAGQRGNPYGYIYEALAYRMAGKNMQPYIIALSGESSDAEFQHEGEEFLYILEGTLEFFYKGKTYILEKGDSAYFNAGIPHSGRSIGNRRARFLCIIYSYKRI